MTPQEKKERRAARHEAQNEARKFANKRIGLFSTPAQVRHASRKLIDQEISKSLNG